MNQYDEMELEANAMSRPLSRRVNRAPGRRFDDYMSYRRETSATTAGFIIGMAIGIALTISLVYFSII